MNHVFAQEQGFFPQATQPDLQQRVERGFHRQHGEHRLGTGQEARHTRRGCVIQPKGEGRALAPPAADGRNHLLLQILADVNKGRRTRATVQIFIGAADRKIGVAGVQRHRHGPGGMAQIPDDQRTLPVGQFGHGRHVVEKAALEGDVRKCQQGGVVIDGGCHGFRVWGDIVVRGAEAQNGMAAAKRAGKALQDVQVGWEIKCIGDDAGTLRSQSQRS